MTPAILTKPQTVDETPRISAVSLSSVTFTEFLRCILDERFGALHEQLHVETNDDESCKWDLEEQAVFCETLLEDDTLPYAQRLMVELFVTLSGLAISPHISRLGLFVEAPNPGYVHRRNRGQLLCPGR